MQLRTLVNKHSCQENFNIHGMVASDKMTWDFKATIGLSQVITVPMHHAGYTLVWVFYNDQEVDDLNVGALILPPVPFSGELFKSIAKGRGIRKPAHVN